MCAGAVAFLKRRDRGGQLDFQALQGPVAAARLPLELTQELKTAVFLSEDESANLYLRSDAVLQALAQVGGIWAILSRILGCVPRSIRDWCYERVANNRHRCALPRSD